jgi:tetratricopeptide (TPR) repeat protein
MKTRVLHLAARISLALAVVCFAGHVFADDDDQSNPPAPVQKEPTSPQHIDKLIRQLGDKSYYVRQRAQDELARLGVEAFDALSDATADNDLEVASRAKYLLRMIRVPWTAPSDPPEVQDCLRDYDDQVPNAREGAMQVLAALPDAQGIAALCRLVRFEQSPLWSKMAALALLSHGSAGTMPTPDVIEALGKGLQGCKRPGAVWLLAWSRLGSDPAAVIAQWDKFVDDEQRSLRQSPDDSSPEIVAGLTRFQVAWLKKLGKTAAVTAAIRRLVDIERGDPEMLAELMPWLIEQKAWKPIDDLARRFATQFSAEPGLLYFLAEAYAEQGVKDRAEETALRAYHLFPGPQREYLLQHFGVAQSLGNRGRFAWSRREFDYVIARGGTNPDELTAIAQTLLAEMLHEQGQDLDAAATLKKLVKAIDAGKLTETVLDGRKPGELRARSYYFLACHAEANHDAAKQREYLDKALAADPEEVDTLIACYRLPGQPPAYRAKIVEAIKKAAATLHQEIAENSDSSPYNQYAWLVGNTEGDLDEALRCSRKSLELRPDAADYLDTLAHVYFRLGDFPNAVKYQTKAAEQEPHSSLIQRELERFRKKLDEKK